MGRDWVESYIVRSHKNQMSLWNINKSLSHSIKKCCSHYCCTLRITMSIFKFLYWDLKRKKGLCCCSEPAFHSKTSLPLCPVQLLVWLFGVTPRHKPMVYVDIKSQPVSINDLVQSISLSLPLLMGIFVSCPQSHSFIGLLCCFEHRVCYCPNFCLFILFHHRGLSSTEPF